MKQLWRGVLAIVLSAGASLPMNALQPALRAVPMTAARLVVLPQLASLGTSSSAVELTIRWDIQTPSSADSSSAASLPPLNQFQVVASRAVEDTLARERDPQLSEDQVVLVAVDGLGNEIGWHAVRDPTLVRAETPDESGRLSGQVFRRPQASFVTLLPQNLASIAELRVYAPRWTGNAWAMDFLGAVTVPANAR